MAQVTSPHWRDEVQALLYRYMTDPGDMCSGRNTYLDKADALLRRAEKREMCMLVDLAVLKISIVATTHQARPFDTIQEMREYPILEPSFNINAYIRGIRATNRSHVIVARVAAFL